MTHHVNFDLYLQFSFSLRINIFLNSVLRDDPAHTPGQSWTSTLEQRAWVRTPATWAWWSKTLGQLLLVGENFFLIPPLKLVEFKKKCDPTILMLCLFAATMRFEPALNQEIAGLTFMRFLLVVGRFCFRKILNLRWITGLKQEC